MIIRSVPRFSPGEYGYLSYSRYVIGAPEGPVVGRSPTLFIHWSPPTNSWPLMRNVCFTLLPMVTGGPAGAFGIWSATYTTSGGTVPGRTAGIGMSGMSDWVAIGGQGA